MSDLTHAFIIDRASKSTAVAVTFTALWTWEEKTPAQHDAQRVGVEAADALAATKQAAMLGARANFDNALDQYHLWTAQALGMARNKARGDAGKRATLSTLGAGSSSRTGIREEGKRWLAWWLQFDPAWVPLTGLTPAAFTALKVQIEGVDNPGGVSTPGLADLYDTKHGEWRAQVETADGLALALEDINEAWYAAATLVFPAGTPQGDLIRGQVPTTYTPGGGPPAPPPPTAVPATPVNVTYSQENPGDAVAAGADAVADAVARIYARLVGETGDPVLVATAGTLPTSFTLAPGDWELTMTYGNAAGESAPTAPVVLTVA